MTNKFVLPALIAAMTCVAGSPAKAVTRFRAIIENEQEVANPPVAEQGSGGEVRGQILLIPEPATWSLCVIGLASLWAMKHRRQQRSEQVHIYRSPL